jgi:hypothetical protein
MLNPRHRKRNSDSRESTESTLTCKRIKPILLNLLLPLLGNHPAVETSLLKAKVSEMKLIFKKGGNRSEMRFSIK